MDSKATSYFATKDAIAGSAAYESVLARVVSRTRELLPLAGVRNTRIGEPDGGKRWVWCMGYDWVMGFLSGQ